MQISQFPVTDEHLTSFQSHIDAKLTPMDCFINAAQLIGILDHMCASILRISCAGSNGFTPMQIEQIFTLTGAWANYNDNPESGGQTPYFHFAKVGSFDLWANALKDSLLPGRVSFTGWQGGGGGHVFLIGRHDDGKLVYLDPQVPANCALEEEQDCVAKLRNGETPDRVYFILYQTEEMMDPSLLSELGFSNTPGRGTAATSAFGEKKQ